MATATQPLKARNEGALRGQTASYRTAQIVGRIVLYTLAVAIAVTSVAPFLWTISTALKDGLQVISYPPKWIPNPAYPQHFLDVIRMEFMPGQKLFIRWFGNTVFVSVVATLGEVLSCAAAGYGFARFRFKGREPLFMLMMASTLLPWVVRIVPLYMMFSKLKWIDTYYPLTVPYFFGGVTFTFLFRQYFTTIPKHLDDAAKIDGASSMGIFFRIILPLSRPIFATAGILAFLSNWNRFLEPLIFLSRSDLFVLGVGLRWFQLQGTTGGSKEPWMASYALLMAIPVLIIFFFCQRYLVQGIALSASKE